MFTWQAPDDAMMNEPQLIPAGYTLNFKIITAEERTTKNGEPMVAVKAEVIDNPEWNGKWVWHNVSFLPKDKKGAGMAQQFLKAIGEQYEGEVHVNTEDWPDSTFRAQVNITEFNGKQRNELNKIQAVPEKADLPF